MQVVAFIKLKNIINFYNVIFFKYGTDRTLPVPMNVKTYFFRQNMMLV
jgi:hypothetical protein